MKRQEPSKKKKQEAKSTVAAPVVQPALSLKKLKLYLALFCAAFAFLLYSNTLHHDYTIDDGTVINNNKLTKQGVKAIPEIFTTAYRKGFWDRNESLYRPLSVAMFAIEWQLSPGNPHLGHWVNVLLYALTIFILFYVLSGWLPGKNLLLSLLITLLYAAHPIHTEVVANIKSRDEILSFLFTMLSFLALSHYFSSGKKINLFLSGISFFLALMSKEIAITCLFIAPLTVWYFRKEKGSKPYWMAALPFAAGSIAYLFLRISVLKGMTNFSGIQAINNSLVNAPDFITEKISAIYILGKYLWLLILPHPLSFDYSYNQIPNVSLTNGVALFALAVFIFLFVYAIITFKEKNITGFGILFFLVTIALISNIFFLIESTLAERFLYLPSLGFCIAIGFFFSRMLKSDFSKPAQSLKAMMNKNTMLVTICFLVIILYSFKTVTRNADWKTNLDLLAKDVQTSPESARIRYAYGSAILIEQALKEKDPAIKNNLLDKAILHLEKGVSILNSYADAFYHLGLAYKEKADYPNAIKNFESAKRSKEFKEPDFYIASGLAYSLAKQYDKGIADFQHALQLDPNNLDAMNNLGVYYDEAGKRDSAMLYLEKGMKLDPKSAKSVYNAGNVLAHSGNYKEAIDFYKKAVAIDPSNVDALNNIGNSYAAMKEYDQAITYYKKVIELDPDNGKVLNNIGVTYSILGNQQEAEKYIQQSRNVQK